MGQDALGRKLAFWVGLAALAAVVVLILVGQISRFLEVSNPELALSINPVNTDARIGAISSILNENNGGEADDQLDRVLTGLKYAPGDARLYSLWGEIELVRNQDENAYRLFNRSLALSKAEQQAIQRVLVREAEVGNFPEAVRHLDVLLRRWPEKYEAAYPVLPALLADPQGYESVMQRLRQGATWRNRLLTDLARGADTGAVAYSIVSDLEADGTKLPIGEVESVIAGLMSSEQHQLSYRTFLLTLDETERTVSGYIFDSEFTQDPVRKTFGWRVSSQPGVQISFASLGDKKGARIHFLSKPVKQIGLQQTLLLAPGPYTLQIIASASALKIPKGLSWGLRCQRGVELTRIQINEGSFRSIAQSVEFAVPLEGCLVQTIGLESGLVTDSWKHRYEGMLDISSVRITRSDL